MISPMCSFISKHPLTFRHTAFLPMRSLLLLLLMMMIWWSLMWGGGLTPLTMVQKTCLSLPLEKLLPSVWPQVTSYVYMIICFYECKGSLPQLKSPLASLGVRYCLWVFISWRECFQRSHIRLSSINFISDNPWSTQQNTHNIQWRRIK